MTSTNAQPVSNHREIVDELENAFNVANEYIHGVADVLFKTTMKSKPNLSQFKNHSINSLMYHCIKQADQADEAFQELLRISSELMRAQEQTAKALETGEFDEIS
ncbi:MAG: hypothetical protein JAZ15_11085 [Candidatus Thiodiazotropha endolucinida]|nr:hypothetical protein [Candidatus Thiodiazotropha taylori]MCW4313562.1 hypothetical protein [Candidatus Thiodiazotropha taylori]